MEKLVKQLAQELLCRGLNIEETKTAIGLLDTQAQFEEMQKEVTKHRTLTKAGVLATAIVITDEIR